MNTRLIITDKETPYFSGTTISRLDSISLTDSGEELVVYWQDWHVIDSVVYKESKDNMSMYSHGFVGTNRSFSYEQFPSPWVDEKYVSYLLHISKEPTQDIQWLDRKSKYTRLKRETQRFWLSVSKDWKVSNKKNTDSCFDDTQLTFDYSSWSRIEIVGVQANPKWKDTWNEKLKLKNISNESISLSWYKLYNWTSKKSFEELYILPWETVEVVGTLWLVNKSRCIALWRLDNFYSPFCYADMGDDDRTTTSLWFKDKPIIDLNKLLMDISIVVWETEACVLIDTSEVSCASLPYSTSEVTERKSDSKNASKLLKKIDKLEQNIVTSSTKHWNKLDSLQWKLDNLNSSHKETKILLSQEKRIASFQSAFIYYIFDSIQEEWPALYYNSWPLEYKKRFGESKQDIASLLWFNPSDIESYIRSTTHKQLLLNTEDVDSQFHELLLNTKTHIDTFKENLTTGASI